MNPLTDLEPAGVAFCCAPGGEIVSVIRDDLGLTRTGSTRSFFDILDPLSLEKARNFLNALQTDGASFGWELNAPVGTRIVPVLFNGGPASEGFTIIGATTRIALTRLTEELMTINNEQTTALRAALKELSLHQRGQAERDSELFDELSRLNNDLVNLQRELARKNRDLEKLNRLKDTFLGMASHDLRKPIAGMVLSSDSLLKDEAAPLSMGQREQVESIKRACGKMIRQLTEFLDVAQIETGTIRVEKQRADLREVVRERTAIYQPYAQTKKIELVCTAGENIPLCAFDRERVEQVIDNLVENAIKYTPPGGRVEVLLTDQKEKVAFCVRDTGPGLSSDQIKQLFLPFSRVGTKTTAGEKSTGVGLAIAKAIMDRHDGELTVQSEPGAGATFCALFPAN